MPPPILFKPPLKRAGVCAVPSERDAKAPGVPFPLFPLDSALPSARHSGGSGRRKFPGKFPFCKRGIFLRRRRDAPSVAVLRGQKQGVEWRYRISNSLPLAGVTFKRFSLNEALAVPSWRFIKAQAGASKDALERKEGERSPSWSPLPSLSPSSLPQLDPSASSQKIKATIFCFKGFCCCCCRLFPVPCPSFQREE